MAMSAKVRGSGRYHVISGDAESWSVVPEGSVRPLRAFTNQTAAVHFAKLTASKKTGEVIVHARSGQVRNMISYAKG